MYTQTSGHGFNLTKVADGFYKSVLGLLSPDNSNAAMYSLISAGLGIYSAVLLFGPHEVRASLPTTLLQCLPSVKSKHSIIAVVYNFTLASIGICFAVLLPGLYRGKSNMFCWLRYLVC